MAASVANLSLEGKNKLQLRTHGVDKSEILESSFEQSR